MNAVMTTTYIFAGFVAGSIPNDGFLPPLRQCKRRRDWSHRRSQTSGLAMQDRELQRAFALVPIQATGFRAATVQLQGKRTAQSAAIELVGHHTPKITMIFRSRDRGRVRCVRG